MSPQKRDQEEFVEINVRMLLQRRRDGTPIASDKAYKFKLPLGTRDIWLPKSQVRYKELNITGKPNVVMVTMPLWLADKQELSDFAETPSGKDLAGEDVYPDVE